MKLRRSTSLLALLTVFLLGQFVYAGPPLKVQSAPAAVKPAIKKEISKEIPLVDPKLSIVGIQTRSMQTLSEIEYQVKIKNESSTPFNGHAQLLLDAKTLILPGQNFSWNELVPAQEIGPLAPGEEKVVSGEASRTQSAVSLRASIKTKDKVWMSKTVKMVEMPTPELEIINLEIRDGKIYATVLNKTNYEIDEKGGLTVQFYGGVRQSDSSVDFSPISGSGLAMHPHGQGTQSARLREGFDVYKVSLIFSRGKTSVFAASKEIDL